MIVKIKKKWLEKKYELIIRDIFLKIILMIGLLWNIIIEGFFRLNLISNVKIIYNFKLYMLLDICLKVYW